MNDSGKKEKERPTEGQATLGRNGKLEGLDTPGKQKERPLQRRNTQRSGISENTPNRKMTKDAIAWSRIWLFVAAGFISLLAFSLFDELLDLPHILLGAPQTPINWAEVIIESVFIAIVGFFAVLVLVRAITERKRVEEALRDSKERFQQVAENTQEWIWEVDNNGLYTYASPMAGKILGYEPEEIVGKKHFYDLFDPEEREEMKKAAFEVFATKQPFREFINRNMCKNGKTVWLSTSGVPVVDEKGNLLGYRGADMDITERKRAEEALKESEERFRTVADFAYDWEYWISASGGYIYISPSCERITKYHADEFRKDPTLLKQITHPDDRSLVAEHFAVELNRGEAASAEFRIISRNGEQRWIEHRCQPVYGHDGRYMGRRASNRDITERKRVEEELKASLREKEVLVSEIHHRVKNNLQVISSLFKLQSEYIRDKRMLEMLKQSQNRVRTMALIHEKLYQSKDLVKIDFADYIRSLATYLFRLYEVSSDAIALKINAGEVSLGIDSAVPCGLIISELISNSLKHAFPAGKKGQIRIEFHSDKDNQFTLIVSDNGVGLPKALDIRKTKSLGLQLVNILTGQLGGAIELDRSDGTTFKITFAETQERKDVI